METAIRIGVFVFVGYRLLKEGVLVVFRLGLFVIDSGCSHLRTTHGRFWAGAPSAIEPGQPTKGH